MSTFVMSDKYPQFCKSIQNLGHTVIFSDTINEFHAPEQQHADMQILKINDKVFVLNECNFTNLQTDNFIKCSKKAGKKYPENILLNCLFINNTLYGKLDAIDKNVLNYCKSQNIRTINVNQGYARCSTAVISDNAVITADDSIFTALKEQGTDVLKISIGNIVLDGFDYGFIGGASGKIDKNTIVFFGNIKLHPNYAKIKNFCDAHNVKLKIINEELPLTDIGGIVKVG